MKLEICANSYQSATNAQNSGAQRIELCSELSVGGITPSYGLLKNISENITIPVNVLIRPRSGNFCYADDEFEQMKSDIKICKKLDFSGIVSGVLNEDNSIDIERTKELIQLSKPLSFTFHRAFDCVEHPKKALNQLMYLGVDRILTSGLQEKAENGIDLLKELQEIAKDNLIILPGSGINSKNAILFKKAGFKEIHSSASKEITSSSVFFDKTPQTVSDLENIQEILKVIKNA
ncbi:copper homeostasis protein CutC [Polaribacter litorisediminis]|uniref:copper homeostasis protein CutC n=1 Tax=Polaribacter litorisediminis TaxID=1908341 RepID=UPI001CBD872E|nr:copper homeostasis protein CutC [Polaribacter litorisediminis]UAM99025.1 copper homeostasis protein CutC [Polaribacter litorisediminis]